MKPLLTMAQNVRVFNIIKQASTSLTATKEYCIKKNDSSLGFVIKSLQKQEEEIAILQQDIEMLPEKLAIVEHVHSTMQSMVKAASDIRQHVNPSS